MSELLELQGVQRAGGGSSDHQRWRENVSSQSILVAIQVTSKPHCHERQRGREGSVQWHKDHRR
jgi:hypothetical protein